MAKIERKKAEEKLISRDEASQEWAAVVAAVMSSLEIFADRLPPVLIGRNRVEMFEIIRDEVWELRNQLYQEGRYTAAALNYGAWKEPAECQEKPTEKAVKKLAKTGAKRKPAKRRKSPGKRRAQSAVVKR